MGMGTLTLACVLLAASQKAEPEVFHMKSPKMAIPITIVPEKRNELREIILYYSMDEGKTWTKGGQATPEQTAFPFTAKTDGKYWFSIQTIDKNGVANPADVVGAPVGQRIIIDTVKPLVRFKAERRGESIAASWEVTEDYAQSFDFRGGVSPRRSAVGDLDARVGQLAWRSNRQHHLQDEQLGGRYSAAASQGSGGERRRRHGRIAGDGHAGERCVARSAGRGRANGELETRAGAAWPGNEFFCLSSVHQREHSWTVAAADLDRPPAAASPAALQSGRGAAILQYSPSAAGSRIFPRLLARRCVIARCPVCSW